MPVLCVEVQPTYLENWSRYAECIGTLYPVSQTGPYAFAVRVPVREKKRMQRNIDRVVGCAVVEVIERESEVS
jgi:hypothetical protein